MPPKGGIRFLLPARQRASFPWEGLPPAWPIFNSQKAADHFTPPPSPSALPNPHRCPHTLHNAIRHLTGLCSTVGEDSVNQTGIGKDFLTTHTERREVFPDSSEELLLQIPVTRPGTTAVSSRMLGCGSLKISPKVSFIFTAISRVTSRCCF